MITLPKRLYIIFISSALFFGIQAMDRDKEAEIEKAVKLIKDKLTEELRGTDKLTGIELIAKFLENFTAKDTANDFMLDEAQIFMVPIVLEVIKPIYKNLTPASKKSFAEIVKAALIAIDKKISVAKTKGDEDEVKDLKKVITDAKIIFDFIDENSDAGIVKQFSLLDLSGKMIVGISLPLAVYGGYKAMQELMYKDDAQLEETRLN